MKRISGATFLMLVISVAAGTENFRTLVAGQIAVSADSASSDPAALPTLGLSYIDSALIALKTVELELKVPQAYLKYRGSLAIAIYKAIGAVPTVGVADVSAERIGFELIPNKLQAVYQIPARKGHGLKASPYVSIPTGIVPPEAFPLLFRIWPVIKGLPEELEQLRFSLTAKPILTDEGALKLTLRYPEKLKDRNVTLRIDDEVRDPAIKEFMLKEGEHNLVIVSDDYRNESRAFTVERGKILRRSARERADLLRRAGRRESACELPRGSGRPRNTLRGRGLFGGQTRRPAPGPVLPHFLVHRRRRHRKRIAPKRLKGVLPGPIFNISDL